MKGLYILINLALIGYQVFAQTNATTAQQYYELANQSDEATDREQAIAIVVEGLVRFPNSSLLHSGLAFFHYENGDTKKAMESCETAILLDKSNDRAYRYLGYIYADKKDHNMAISYFTKAIELFSKSAVTYNNRGKSYWVLGKIKDAISDFEKAIELDSSDHDSYAILAYLQYGLKNYDRAISLAKKSIELFPTNRIAIIVLETAEKEGVSIGDSGNLSISITVNLDFTQKDYLTAYPYLQANSLDTLIDRRLSNRGIIYTYTFDKVSKMLSVASMYDYSDSKQNSFNNYLTKWIKDNDDLSESTEDNVRLILNMTPYFKGDSRQVVQSLGLSNEQMVWSLHVRDTK